jgi:hypothetical protein
VRCPSTPVLIHEKPRNQEAAEYKEQGDAEMSDCGALRVKWLNRTQPIAPEVRRGNEFPQTPRWNPLALA